MYFFQPTDDRSKSDERNFRKSCDLSSYQMSPHQHQNLAVFGVRHDLFNNHVRFEVAQKAAARPRATSSDFFVQQKSKDEKTNRDRSTSRRGTRVSPTSVYG